MAEKIYKLSEVERAKAREWQREFRLRNPSYESEVYRKKIAKNPNLNKEQYWNNREKFLARARDCKMRTQFGISVEDYDRVLAEQGGVCAICRKPETVKVNGKITRLAVDHNHDTDRVRGLLCNACNRLLAAAKERETTLERAIQYLQYWDAMDCAPLVKKEA